MFGGCVVSGLRMLELRCMEDVVCENEVYGSCSVWRLWCAGVLMFGSCDVEVAGVAA